MFFYEFCEIFKTVLIAESLCDCFSAEIFFLKQQYLQNTPKIFHETWTYFQENMNITFFGKALGIRRFKTMVGKAGCPFGEGN